MVCQRRPLLIVRWATGKRLTNRLLPKLTPGTNVEVWKLYFYPSAGGSKKKNWNGGVFFSYEVGFELTTIGPMAMHGCQRRPLLIVRWATDKRLTNRLLPKLTPGANVEVWERKLYFYPSAGGLKIK